MQILDLQDSLYEGFLTLERNLENMRDFSSPLPLTNYSIFHPPLINYWGKFLTRVWNDILILTFLRSGKRSDPSVVCFVLQVRAKEPTQCFAFYVSIKNPAYWQVLTSFGKSNRMFVELMFSLNPPPLPRAPPLFPTPILLETQE